MSDAVRTDLANEARAIGTEGCLRIPDFWHSKGFEMCQNDKVEQFEHLSGPQAILTKRGGHAVPEGGTDGK